MAMNSLILSRDANAIGLLRRVLGDSGVLIETCTGVLQFKELVTARKFDAVFLDCDDVDGAAAAFKEMRGLPSNRKTLGFAIVNGVTTLQQAFEMGANFVLDKPLVADRIARSLRAAQGLMASERRRYYRHPVSTTIHLTLGTEAQERMGTTVNVSEGGLAIALKAMSNPAMPLRFRFKLPASDVWITGKGEIAWVAGNLTGIKFETLEAKAREYLQEWLAKKMTGPDVLPPVFINATSKRYY
jgi:CheY-like chemotaxis protein